MNAGDEREPEEGVEDALLGRVLDGRYRVLAPLGEGGVGAVYKGEHVQMRKPVALKVLHAAFARTDTFRKRFEREARAASRLFHPGCVSVLDFGTVSRVEPAAPKFIGTPYLVMEFVSGELLLDRLDRGKLPVPEALHYARGMLTALRHAHQLGIVHRDVKPANIMLASVGDEEPLVKLLDFGLAKSFDPDSPDARQPLTQMGTVFGTPGYLSPEQAGGQPADVRSDLYSVGVVLFEMVCGRPPFVRDQPLEVVRDHILTAPPKPTSFTPEMPTPLETVILKALAKKPDDRFQSADEFLQALGTMAGAGLRQPHAVIGRLKQRRAWLVIGASIIALAIATMTLANLLRAPKPTAELAPSPPPTAQVLPRETPISPSALRHLDTAEDYQRRLWCADAIDELQRALRDDPRLRSEPAVTRTAIPCLRARTQAKTVRFFVDSIGESAIDELRAAASGDIKPDVREGARRALAEMEGGDDHVN